MPSQDSSTERWWTTNPQSQPRIGVCRRCLGDILNKGTGWYHASPQAHVENPHYPELQVLK